MARRVPKRRSSRSKGPVVLVATRKGAWVFRADASRRSWRSDGPHFLGHVIHHVVLDPRDGRTLLASASTGHLGPTLYRSADLGRSWKEAKRPPAFPKAVEGETGRAVGHTFWLTPGHPSQPGTWYAGTSPHGLFRSGDGGESWEPVSGLNDDPRYREWMGGPQDGTPDGPKLHSVIVDPRDPAHLYLGMSSGGVHESLDEGRTWHPMVSGMEVVDGFDPARITFHDPHCVRLSPRIRTASTSRTTAASTGSTGRARSGCASARPCRGPWATSASRWWSTRAIPTGRGSSPWTGPRSGPGRAPEGGPRRTGRATEGGHGAGSTAGSRGGTPGGR